jgi:hypothetical protein
MELQPSVCDQTKVCFVTPAELVICIINSSMGLYGEYYTNFFI